MLQKSYALSHKTAKLFYFFFRRDIAVVVKIIRQTQPFIFAFSHGVVGKQINAQQMIQTLRYGAHTAKMRLVCIDACKADAAPGES